MPANPALPDLLAGRVRGSRSDEARTHIGGAGFAYTPAHERAFAPAFRENEVWMTAGAATVRIAPGSTGNVLSIGDIDIPNLVIDIRGNDNLVIVGRSHKLQGRLTIVGDGNTLFLGDGSTCNRGNFVLCGDGLGIVLGQDCMLSFDVSLRAGDSHGLFDIATLEPVSAPASILVEPHVWLGEGVSVLKGVRIGAGTIVGAGAVVSSSLEGASVAVGTPARVLRSGVSWTRKVDATPADRQRVLALLASAAER